MGIIHNLLKLRLKLNVNCNKQYNSKYSLKRHYKICKIKKENIEKELIKKDTEIKILKARLDEASKPTTVNNTINNININVQVNGYRDTDFSKIKDREFSRALSRTLLSIPQLIEFTHFNPKRPENHNIYISNHKGKYAMIYNGQDWEIKDKIQTIDRLIDNQEYELEQWVNRVEEKHPKEMDKFQRYLDVKEKDGALDVLKEEVKLLLYNKRNVIIK